MPFGLKGAPATFQRLMNQVLLGLQGLQCFVYLDDVVIYGKDSKDHFFKLHNILDRLREANLKLHPQKCFFLRKEIIYLGHLCGKDGCQPDPEKVKVMDKIKVPTRLKEIQSFLGVLNYYRRFIPDFARVAIPLVNLTKKGVKYLWTEECQSSFEQLKTILKEQIVLKYPDFSQSFEIHTDASKWALGGVLSQNDQPVSFASKTLTSAETRYSTIEKELYAIVWAVEHFRPYVYGTKFVVFTDHKPLLGIHKHRNPSSRLLRLFLKLSDFDVTLEYKPGRCNLVADALSRLPLNINAITRAQRAAELTKRIVNKPNTNPPDGVSPIKRVTRSQSLATVAEVEEEEENIGPESVVLETGDREAILKFFKQNKNVTEVTCPRERENILKQFHEKKLGGHQGVNRTRGKIRRYFTWPGLNENVDAFVKNCEICQKSKTNTYTRMRMHEVEVSKYPFYKIFLDIVGPLDVSDKGNKYILTVMDDLSRYFNAYPLPNQEAATLCYAFVTFILAHHKTPRVVLTDRGTNFMSDEFSKVCKLFGIKKVSTSPYHPQSNGALERAHRSLGHYLRAFVKENPRGWDDLLTYTAYVHNNSVNRSTKLAPNDILYGYISNMPVKIKLKPEAQYNFDSQYSNIYHSLQKVWAWAKENQEKAKELSKEYYDRQVKEQFFKKGDKVFVRNEARKGKFAFLWNGPFEVVKPSGNVNTVVRIKRRNAIIHNNRLKICYPLKHEPPPVTKQLTT
jgi:hypothetical protein